MKVTPLLVLALGLCACGDADGSERISHDAAAGLDAAAEGGTPPELDAASPDSEAGANDDAASAASEAGAPQTSSVRLPPENAGLDYQLGGAYAPPAGVGVVSRDRQDAPAAGLYNICYVNGFQAQPGENAFWLGEQPDLLLRDGAGDPVIDPDWDEMLLDVSSPDKRTRLAAIVGAWIEQCGRDGFDAVEIDNLDTYSRSAGRIKPADAVAFVALLSDVAHAAGLAIAQKNAAELVERKADMRTDFVVAEECNQWNECDVYQAAYGNHVLVIEYRRNAFEAGCTDYPELSIVLRDIEVSPAGSVGYLYDGC